MIEIPDLDDLKNYAEVEPESGYVDEISERHLDEDQGFMNETNDPIFSASLGTGGRPNISQLEQIEEGVQYMSLNGGLNSSSDKDSDFSDVQVWRTDQILDKPENVRAVSDSNFSLLQSKDSYDIMPQVVEYSTAEAMPVQNFDEHPFNEDPEDISYNNRVHLVPTTNDEAQPMKLQEAPSFHYSRNDSLKENVRTDDTFDAKDLQSSLSNKISFPELNHNDSPSNDVHVSYNVNPSPQLPPPMSATSMKRLTLSNGEEFSSIRKGLATESKTTAEYTLHIIFTQFVRHAERKLNLCLDYSLDEEPPIADLLAEGVDPQFDHIVQSLGYIARRKPKPVIDSVMFWRKSKSEVASMAAEEVERTLNTAKNNLLKISSMSSNEEDSSQVQTINPGPGRSKRSLSLMRSKSISKITGTHRRNQSTSAAVVRETSVSPKGNKKRSIDNNFLKLKAYHDEQIAQIRETAIQADRKSLASIYILCRVLIEIVKQTSNEIIGDDLGYKLEEIVYTQLKTTDPVSTRQSSVRSANWNLFAELLGYMSIQRFLSVSDRFIAEFEKIPAKVKPEDEPRLHLLIYGMKYLKLTNYPLESFEESADFLLSLAKFFERTTNESLVFAYCEVLSNLMLPLANILTAEANHPTWVEAIEKIHGQAYKIWSHVMKSNQTQVAVTPGTLHNKSSIPHTLGFTNSWAYSIHLMTSSLSVSRKELFSEYWFNLIEENQFKLKPKVETEDKSTYIICTARLLWVYIYRVPDTLNNTIKRLDQLFQILFFNNNSSNKKHQWITSDLRLIEGLVELIRVVGYQHLNYALDEIIIELLKSAFNGTTLENMVPEKLIVVIKGYLAILEDRELGQRPTYPTDDVLARGGCPDAKGFTKDKSSRFNFMNVADFQFAAKTTRNAVSHEEICKSFATLLKLLDGHYGSDVWSLDNSNQNTPLSSSFSLSQSTFSNFHFGIDFAYQAKMLNIEMFTTLIEAVPWTMVSLMGEKSSPSGIQFKSVVEILTRNALHSDQRIAAESVSALKRLASRKNPTNLVTSFANIAFQFSDKPNPNHDIEYMYSAEFHKMLKIYVELLNCWYQQLNQATEYSTNGDDNLIQDDEAMSNDVLNDLYQVNYNTEIGSKPKKKANDEFEWKAIITVIEEIEGNGLFFLCSQDSKTRHYGLSILKLVEQFDQALYNMTDTNIKSITPTTSDPSSHKTHSRTSSKYAADIGTRLVHILENTDFLSLIQPIKKELSVPEKTRLSKLKNKKNILMRLAESDYGIDSTIWFRLYPKVLDIFFEKCPMPVAICRSIVCVKMVQMHEAIYDFSESYKSYTSMFSRSNSGTPPEVLVNQWKLYLVFTCCSLTSTNEQKISFPTQPLHGRKKSMQMYIQHQKITSAKSIFRMVLPLLKSQQSMVREAVISGVSCVNINIFKTLLENVPISLNDWNVSKRESGEDRLRIEIIHVLANITTRFKHESSIYSDEWMTANLVSVIKNVKSFLSMNEIQTDVFFQKLRHHFAVLLENVFVGFQTNTILNKWIPFEARIGCFNFLKEWCDLGASKVISEERYNLMTRRVSNQKDATTAIAILEVEKKALQLASLSCMSVLCSGPVKQQIGGIGNTAVMSFDVSGLMKWVKALFESGNSRIQDVGKIALKNILQSNLDNEEVYQEVIKECYMSHSSARITEFYFTIFVDVYLTYTKSNETPFDVLCLASFLVGNDNYQVRFASIKLLKFLEENFFNSTTIDQFTESVCSKTKVIYKKALYKISAHWASVYPDGAFDRISCLTMFFNLVDDSSHRDILSCLLPWMQIVELKETDDSDTDAKHSQLNSVQLSLNSSSIMVLNNLFEITVKFSSRISNEVEALWMALGGNATNFDKIIEFLMSSCLERKNPLFVEYSQQIIDYLSYSQANKLYIIDKFINHIQPKTLIPPQPSLNIVYDEKEFPYIANLWKVVPAGERDATFSLGQLSMVFLVDLFATSNEKMIEHLSLLLHVAFSLLDHYLPLVQDQACTLLVHLIKALASNEAKSKETVSILRQRDYHKSLWVYDDLNNDKKGARTPRNMDTLVRNVLELFTPIAPTLQEEWSRVSLSWATTCAVRHIACRSFQLFRSLLSFLDQSMLKDMLHRLSNTISDGSMDIQGFAMQILMTLNAITAELDSEKLIDYPQLFWSSVACLSTIHEQEFTEVLSTMSKFVSKIDLDSPETVSCLISTFPPKWEGKFEGLQHLVLTGLRSANVWEPCIKFLDKLNHLKDSEIIGMGDARLVMIVVANLPRFLHALEEKAINKEIEEAALTLSIMAKNNDKVSLARILESLSKNKFRSKKDFLEQCLSTIKNDFFPEYEAQVLVLLLGILSNKTSWVKIETMSLLKRIFQFVDLEQDEFVGVGADLISPLLRLLLTKYAEPALEVLDEAVVISGSQLDKDVLRMSLGNASMKKQYEKTATLFGIPDESGWSIPMPAVTSASTRNNVHAVFLTCTVATVVNEEEDQNKDEEIHFHMDDFYDPSTDHGDTVSVSVDEPDASLSNVWAALDDFDSFFTKDANNNVSVHVGNALFNGHRENHHTHSASVDTGYSSSSDIMAPMDSAPQVYDKKASVILNRSLDRTHSNLSFKNSLTDNIGTNLLGVNATSSVGKRSYIPFRSNKANTKTKGDSLTTPVLPLSPTFDAQSASSPFRSSALTTPTAATFNDTSSPNKRISTDMNLIGASADHNRFEGLIGGNKKKSRRSVKYSPSSSSNSVSPDLHSHYWHLSKSGNNSLNYMSTPPSTAPVELMSAAKVREKRKSSQKLKQ